MRQVLAPNSTRLLVALESGENLFTLTFVILKSVCWEDYIELEKNAASMHVVLQSGIFANVATFHCVFKYGKFDFFFRNQSPIVILGVIFSRGYLLL